MKVDDDADLNIRESSDSDEESKGNNKKLKGETGSSYPPNYRVLYRMDKVKRRMISYDFKNNKLRKINYTEPPLDDYEEELEFRNMSVIYRGILSPDSKSICNDIGEIFLFGATETKFSNCFMTMEGNEIEQLTNLPIKRKKISCAINKSHIYFTGEFENINADRTNLERYDTDTNSFEQILGLNKQSNYILCILNSRYLYAFPYSINSYKILMLDLANLVETKEGVLKGEWSKLSPKNPNNLNLYISYKSSAVQISH